jgi:uncharacterized protein (DUF169 family)
MFNPQLSEAISAKLELDTPPIALTFVEAAPAGITSYEQTVPSACTFWRKAEQGVFYASAERHFNCPIGAMTMGFEMPAAVQQELMGLVQFMFTADYLAADEPSKIPTIKKDKKGIVYGPLRDFPLEPDLILVWLTPRQAMYYNEIVGTVQWTSTTPMPVFGRPACAALPMAFANGQSTLSLGCIGMRTFTEISNDRLLVVLPGSKANEFLNALAQTMDANQTMCTFYEQHKTRFSA